MGWRTVMVLMLIGIAVLAVGSWLYFFPAEPGSPFEKLAAAYQQLTVPAGAKMGRVSAISTKGHSRIVDWEFETEWEWGRYREWLKHQMEGRFRLTKALDNEMVFVRTDVGDTYGVKVENLNNGRPVRIRITFFGIAS